MSNGEMAYLALVLIAFASFMGGLGFVSIWSRRPTRASSTANQAAPVPGAKKWEVAPAASVALVTVPPRAA